MTALSDKGSHDPEQFAEDAKGVIDVPVESVDESQDAESETE